MSATATVFYRAATLWQLRFKALFFMESYGCYAFIAPAHVRECNLPTAKIWSFLQVCVHT